MDKLKSIFDTLKQVSSMVQDLVSVNGGIYVDAFAVVMIVRLLGPLKGYPAMNAAEAGMWAATIAAFAASNIGTPKS